MTKLLLKLFLRRNRDKSKFQLHEGYGKFASMVGAVTNVLLFIIKIITGMVFGSIAIVADAINNLSDCGSSLVTLVGFKISGKPADEQHPFGHARMEYISGLIISFVILMLGFQMAQNSIAKILHPQSVKFSIISVAVLAISILVKLWQSMFYRTVGKRIDSTTLIAAYTDSRNDVITTAAVLISTIALPYTSFNLDGYMGLVVSLFILVSGYQLVTKTISPLLGNAPTKELVDQIYGRILGYDGILGLHDLAVHSYGPGTCFASVHCEVDARQDILVSHDIIDNIERDFLKNYNIHLVIHLDPIVTNDPKTNELREKIKSLVGDISPDVGIHDFRVVWGVSHSNLIFDVVVPFSFDMDDRELVKLIADRIKDINPNYNAVVTVDHDYVPRPEADGESKI